MELKFLIKKNFKRHLRVKRFKVVLVRLYEFKTLGLRVKKMVSRKDAKQSLRPSPSQNPNKPLPLRVKKKVSRKENFETISPPKSK